MNRQNEFDSTDDLIESTEAAQLDRRLIHGTEPLPVRGGEAVSLRLLTPTPKLSIIEMEALSEYNVKPEYHGDVELVGCADKHEWLLWLPVSSESGG